MSWGPFLESPGKSFRVRKANFKSPLLKKKKILSFETLHKCKLYLNAKPVEIKSSVNQALHGFSNGFSGSAFEKRAPDRSATLPTQCFH